NRCIYRRVLPGRSRHYSGFATMVRSRLRSILRSMSRPYASCIRNIGTGRCPSWDACIVTGTPSSCSIPISRSIANVGASRRLSLKGADSGHRVAADGDARYSLRAYEWRGHVPTFKAIVIEKSDGGQKVRLADFDEANLMEGDVTVRVEWSTVNYKDGL